VFQQRNRDIVSSLVCAGIGLLFFVGSFKYGDIRGGVPNAGLFPFLAGCLLMILSLTAFFSAMTAKEEGKRETFFPQANSLKKLLILMSSLIAYEFSLALLGFIITTFLFMMFLLRFIEPQKWTMVVSASILTTAFSYIIFQLFLKVQLPHGIF
jgi:putative tricarboxylic transport membrane protein